METQRDPNFPRRLDQNGIYHSICLTCFQTVSTSFSQASLMEGERQHACAGPPLRTQVRIEFQSRLGRRQLQVG